MIPFEISDAARVGEREMCEVYERLRTPCKRGAVIKVDGKLCDSPTVFRHRDRWYMSFIEIDSRCAESGYDSHLAVSDDLLTWEYLGTTLERDGRNGWDSKQIALYAAFVDNELHGSHTIKPIGGLYRFACLGGNLNGYETDPLSMGECTAEDPARRETYRRSPAPILSPDDPDARAGETRTLYKAHMFEDPAMTLGYPYVSAYNAKDRSNKESIYLAVSRDGVHWERYGEDAVILDDSPERNIQINGDPQILRLGALYIMLYFIYRGGRAYNTFACSYDLVHWTKWQGRPLIESEYAWEDVYAHKPWMVSSNGVLYHYYCAVNSEGERFIALATSETA